MSKESAVFRPPVVTILGHVDHGKTSLLDRIRKSNVASGEVGGITQAIGAYQIEYRGRKLTFIDTPGHAAFSAMRRRGGQAADIAVLIIAADDSVMPQTRESIEHIKNANIPFVVVINKVDLPGINLEKIKTDLANCEVFVEGYGGNIPMVNISAKSGQGIDELLEIILLLADLEELKDTSKEQPAQAIVIESALHPQKGSVATLLVKTGTFNKNEDLFVGQKNIGKIRSMTDFSGKPLVSAPPSTPFQVIGLSAVPNVGDILANSSIASPVGVGSTPPAKMDEIGQNRLPIILKADVQGSLEAITTHIKDQVNVVNSSVGAVTETDIQTAVASGAEIIGFNSKIPATTARLAEVEGIKFTNFKIIYQLFDYLTEIQNKKNIDMSPKFTEMGQARVLKIFNFAGTIVIGASVISGKIKLGDDIMGSKVVSLKVNKADVEEVKKDQEFGVVLKPQIELKEGDIMTAIQWMS